MAVILIFGVIIPFITFVVVTIHSEDEATGIIGAAVALAIGICVSAYITTTLGQDYEIYLADEQPICTLSGEETYIQVEGNTYYYYTEDENGEKHRNSINSWDASIIENADAPVIKLYMRNYKGHWYSCIPDNKFDHYEICIPETNQS